jgi:predicted AAA+ superfamily ATPase
MYFATLDIMNNKAQRLLDMLNSGSQTAEEIREANTHNRDVSRRAYLSVQARATSFTRGAEQKVWIAMPGLRGIGKTTILAQLHSDPAFSHHKKIFASFDRLLTLGANIQDFIDACEAYIGTSFETFDKPLVLLLDEVQYLENWAVGLKTVLDRSNNIFIFCTGSSALSIQTDPNVARRMDIVKLHPLCFTEYVLIKQAHEKKSTTRPIPGLAKKLRGAIFEATDAIDCYKKLSDCTTEVNTYWKRTGFPKNELFGEYLAYGTLPFTLDLPNRATIWDRINRILSESLDRDVIKLGRFDSATISVIPQLLFLLASSVETSINGLCNDLNMNQRTVTSILDALEKTEIITAIPPKGAHNGNIKKASKYMFTSPAMRAALCNFGGIITPDNNTALRGTLLEDIVAMYFKRLFLDAPLTRAIVEYDTAKGGADFIISPDGTRRNSLAIEVGARKTTSRQAVQTLNDIKGKYGMVVTSGSLAVQKNSNTVTIPFEYFFLI